MKRQNPFSRQYKSIVTLALAMMAGVIGFSVFCLAIHFTAGHLLDDIRFKIIFLSIDFLIGAALIITGSILYANHVKTLKAALMDPEGRMASYRAIVIIHLTFSAMPSLLSIICFLIFGDFIYFLIVGASLFELVRRFPTVKRMDDIVSPYTYLPYRDSDPAWKTYF